MIDGYAMYTVLMPAEAADQVLAIYREYAVRAPSLSVWKPMLPMPVLCKEWERHNLPIRELTDGLECALEKGWIMKDADSESWLLTELEYNHAIGSYFYRHGMSVTS
jgi:hypothetical protein